MIAPSLLALEAGSHAISEAMQQLPNATLRPSRCLIIAPSLLDARTREGRFQGGGREGRMRGVAAIARLSAALLLDGSRQVGGVYSRRSPTASHDAGRIEA